jgi:hypothetical protein
MGAAKLSFADCGKLMITAERKERTGAMFGWLSATLGEVDENIHGAVSDRLYDRRLHNIASDRECAE